MSQFFFGPSTPELITFSRAGPRRSKLDSQSICSHELEPPRMKALPLGHCQRRIHKPKRFGSSKTLSYQRHRSSRTLISPSSSRSRTCSSRRSLTCSYNRSTLSLNSLPNHTPSRSPSRQGLQLATLHLTSHSHAATRKSPPSRRGPSSRYRVRVRTASPPRRRPHREACGRQRTCRRDLLSHKGSRPSGLVSTFLWFMWPQLSE